jgi:SSS family solute:Na+ symporter
MPWPYVDPMIIALPVSFIVTIVVTLLTHNSKEQQEEIDKMFDAKNTIGDAE